MADWKTFLKKFLATMDYATPPTAGFVSHDEAIDKAYREYDRYRRIQDQHEISDFDMFLCEPETEYETMPPFEIDIKSLIENYYKNRQPK